MAKAVNIGIMGLGTVGSGLVQLIERNADMIERKSDVRLVVKRILVKDSTKPRAVPQELLTTDPTDLFCDPEIDIVVELIGGVEDAKRLILAALARKKSVVTANKAVLADSGAEIIEAAATNGCRVGFEASVCGGIPIIQALGSGLIANRVDELVGILNGTTNFIVTMMAENGLTYEDALALAQEKGLAEPDPTFDVKGIDAAHKLLILAELTFQVSAELSKLIVEGIERIEPEDIRVAKEFGFAIKPISVARLKDDKLDLRVHPGLVAHSHPLANVNHEYNAVVVKGDAIGEMVFYGKGAGSFPTASAVLSDIVEIVRSPHSLGSWHPQRSVKLEPVPSESRFYLRFPIFDRAGLIGKIATVLGDHGISITHAQALLVCAETSSGNVMIVTHRSPENAITDALREIEAQKILTGPPLAIRIVE